MKVNSRWRIGAALLLTCTGFLGCGGGKPTASVSGTITFNKKAPDVLGLAISFMPPDGQPVAFGVNKDGTFKGDGVPVGANKLSLSFSGGEPEETTPQSSRLARMKKGAPQPDTTKELLKAAGISIPANLKDPHKSGKTLLVEAGKENTLEWDIKQ